jgi:NDP-sugar pyrophosphorylase family protein
MTVLMPMSGYGSRFSKAGIKTPKPLIEVCGKTLSEWALSSLPDRDFKLVLFSEHEKNPVFHESEILGQVGPSLFTLSEEEDVLLYRETLPLVGAAGSVYRAIVGSGSYLDRKAPITVSNCDHSFSSIVPEDMPQLIKVRNGELDGLIFTFQLEDAINYGASKWSYAVVDELGNVKEVIEKPDADLVQDNWEPTIGVYCWSSAQLLLDALEEMFDAGPVAMVNNEFYLAPVYNYMSLDKVQTAQFTEMDALGTPEDIQKFLYKKWFEEACSWDKLRQSFLT